MTEKVTRGRVPCGITRNSSVACGSEPWTPAPRVAGHMGGGPDVMHDRFPCPVPRGRPNALGLVQELIYYFCKNQYVFIDCISRVVNAKNVFRPELG